MDLRDELAARVAAGLAVSALSPETIAARVYAIADAMLRARGAAIFGPGDALDERAYASVPPSWAEVEGSAFEAWEPDELHLRAEHFDGPQLLDAPPPPSEPGDHDDEEGDALAALAGRYRDLDFDPTWDAEPHWAPRVDADRPGLASTRPAAAPARRKSS